MVRSEVAIVIPAKNECKTLSKIINRSKKFGIVYVVDDNSTDNTRLVAKLSGAKVIVNNKTLNYDESINKAFKKIRKKRYKFIITIDADGELDPKYLKQMTIKFKNNYELVLAEREVLNRSSEYLSKYLYKRRYGINDIFCGLKGYKISSLLNNDQFNRYNSLGIDLALTMIRRGVKFTTYKIKSKTRSDTPRVGSFLMGHYKIIRSTILSTIF